ncbi:hybrid sensor histidine kinase/response regulator [Candidatus Nitrotoga arctica]|uniref:histidine kinase n=1 Tax=Candidatus Nitrotoga arctica TaxID=453162 RepID=A0ABN8AMV6_9PROT|nr:PAS domain-containing hybrid sensor histidine kinase/response regulator [Candidatus Nitrotoga arctica]CAG9932063.1 Histidine kinase [Candidatus Nitrotoga arctica]
MISKKIRSEVTPKIGLTMAIFFALFVVFSFYVISEKKVDRANEQRLISFVLANQLHQSSDDLTRMARAFVVTGNPRYKKYYQDILDIRDGKKPRPEGYFYGYWDMVLANAQPPNSENGQAIPLLDLMRQSGFPDDELGKLTEAKANSDGLTTMEFVAMKLVESADPDMQVKQERARLMLHNENYYQAKAKIMGPINDAYFLMEKRTLDVVHNAKYIALIFRLIFIAATLGVIFMLWRTYVSLRATLGGSADEVQTQITRIGRGDFSTISTIKGGMENSVVAGLSKMQNKLQANEIERKQAEEALRIAAVAFESQESLMITDANGVVLRVNKAFTKTTGYTAEEVIGQTPKLFQSDLYDADFYDAMWETIQLTGTWHGEVWGSRKNGELYPKWLTISAVQGDDGAVTHYVGADIDITELSNARIAAEKANRAKSEFISSMSHELRTPLNAILGFAQLLEHGSPAPTPTQMIRLKEILRGGWYLLDLINEILDLALIESGKVSLSPEHMSLQEILLECKTMMEPQAKLRDIQLNFPQLDHSLFVYADRTRVKQVLINLLSNAIKYNCEHGTVEVTCNANALKQVRISIKDTGEGLFPEKLAHLFQPFNRLGQESSAVEGTGIGLVVSKKLIEQMGGNIGVESTVGAGSVFWFDLALAEELQRTEVPNESITHVTKVYDHSQQRTLLYVEDNPANLSLVEHIIEGRPDIRLLSAMNGNVGIELAGAHLPDVILMDINLPGISGVDVMRILRSEPLTKHIPIIALSANVMLHDIANAMEAGCFRYLSKPIELNEFMSAIDEVLGFADMLSDRKIETT